MDSFYKTVELAQHAGAKVNITWWFLDRAPKDDPTVQQQLMQQDMQEFASTLVDLVTNHGLTAVQQITIQNEVNTSWVKPQLYEQYYRLLDQELRNAGIRDHIKFVGGDLVINNQLTWFNYMAAHMGDVLDGWSVHIYWNYWDTAYMQSRLNGILAIYNAIPVEERKPLSITEYGVRGIKTLNGKTIMDVDPYRKGALTATLAGYYQDASGNITPVNETNIVALRAGVVQHALSERWFYRNVQMGLLPGAVRLYLSGLLAHRIHLQSEPGQDRWPVRPSLQHGMAHGEHHGPALAGPGLQRHIRREVDHSVSQSHRRLDAVRAELRPGGWIGNRRRPASEGRSSACCFGMPTVAAK